MNREKTDQERFWEGQFGEEYIERNQGQALLNLNMAFFARIFRHMNKIDSIIEFGSNIGMNLRAIQQYMPDIKMAAIESNAKAVKLLSELNNIEIYHQSILEYKPQKTYDLALIKTVLIHIHPDLLKQVYELLVASSNRYICVAEYYSTSPVEVEYRGHKSKLFKRDFVGEMLDQYDNLQLLDYSFSYNRDPYFPQDDITWFLLEKK